MKPKVTCYCQRVQDGYAQIILSAEPPVNGFCSVMLWIDLPGGADLEAAVREKAYWKLKQEVGENVVKENYKPEDIEVIDETPKPEPFVEEPSTEDVLAQIEAQPKLPPKKKKKR
jgi:hypothetical protein